MEPRFARALLLAYKRVASRVPSRALAAALRARNFALAVSVIDAVDFGALTASANILRDAFARGARAGAARVGSRYGFDGRNLSAQAAVGNYARSYVWRVERPAREAINAVVLASIRDGIAPRDATRLLENVIGLDARSAGAVERFYVDQVSRLVAGGSAPAAAAATAGARASRYALAKLRERAERVARTEVMGALNAGALESYREAVADGYLTVGAVKEWVATPGACPEICEPLDHVRVPLDGSFPGGYDAPPAHPYCRCAVAVVEPRPR